MRLVKPSVQVSYEIGQTICEGKELGGPELWVMGLRDMVHEMSYGSGGGHGYGYTRVE